MGNGPVGFMYASSDSGWMDKSHFTERLQSVFWPATEPLRKAKPVMLILDGDGSHVSLNVILNGH